MNGFRIQNYIPVLIVIFFLAVVVGSGLLIWPKAQETRALQKEIKAKRDEVKRTEGYFIKLKETKMQLETEYLDELSKISSSLPSGTAMPSLLKFLQESSAQSGLLLKSIDPTTEDPLRDSDVKTLKVAMDLEGSYSSFKNFLAVLENSARLIEAENISFSSDRSLQKKEKKPEDLSSFHLEIKTFSH